MITNLHNLGNTEFKPKAKVRITAPIASFQNKIGTILRLTQIQYVPNSPTWHVKLNKIDGYFWFSESEMELL